MKTQSPISVTLPNCAITHYWIAIVIDMGIFMKEKISGIYQIQSKIKPKRIYIGSAVSIKDRWWNHISILKSNKHHSKKLQNHFNKYGESDLQYSILLGCEIPDLIKAEQYFIDSYNPYFNICKIAGNTLGCKASEETKLKIREAWKTRPPMSDETRLKYSKVKIGIKFTDEHKRKISEVQIGKKLTEKTKIKISNSLKGKKQSDETKVKIAKAMIGNKNRTNRLKFQ